MKKTLLVELLVEEMPPRALSALGGAFASYIHLGLGDAGLVGPDATSTFYATPRRLAVTITSVLSRAPDRNETRKLMPSKAAFDSHGQPSVALTKRLEKEHADLGQIEKRLENAVEYVFLNRTIRGMSLMSGLQTALEKAVNSLPAPKQMRYQIADPVLAFDRATGARLSAPNEFTSDTVEFVRPAHGLVALYGDEVVPVDILGLQAGRKTSGHRFLCDHAISIKHADQYVAVLRDVGKVEPAFTARRARIKEQLKLIEHELAGEMARRSNGRISAPLALVIDTERDGPIAHTFPQSASLDDVERALFCSGGSDLLDEVTALVEWPRAYWGKIDQKFLELPVECLALTMKQHQKYFPVFNTAARLQPCFVIIANNDDLVATQDGATIKANIQIGNERVLRPRLSDARFFFEQDKKQRLEQRVPQLSKVVYQNKLGSQLQRTERIQLLAGEIARQLKANVQFAERAAWLSKADLLTEMVGEFPELQGTMGRYYALDDREEESVANAIEGHYRPRFAGDRLPDGHIASAVALADKLDMLVGMFAVGNAPTGERDPFGLRRQALGIVRILIEKELSLDLVDLVERARDLFLRADLVKALDSNQETWLRERATADVLEFIFERTRSYLKDNAFVADEIESVLASGTGRLDLIPARLNAVREFKKLPEAESLASANKRIRNILRKSETTIGTLDEKLLREPAERALYESLRETEPRVHQFVAAGDYIKSLSVTATLEIAVNSFFDKVLVNAEDSKLRSNRHALLKRLESLMNNVADISKLAK